MRTSETIDKLAPALVKAQAEMGTADKNAVNPHFKNKYADLQSIVDAVKPALVKHKIAVLQEAEGGDGTLLVNTRLLHESGQFIEGTTYIPIGTGSGPQQAGSGITYGKRYGLAALLGIVADEDDDGNAAQGTQSQAGYTASHKPAATQTTAAPAAPQGGPLGSFVINFGKFKGKTLDEISVADGGRSWMEWIAKQEDGEKGPSLGKKKILEYLGQRAATAQKARTPATQAAVAAAAEVGFDEVPDGLDEDETELPF